MSGLVKHSFSNWDKYFLNIALICSKMSKDPSTKVGSVIKYNEDKSVVSTGYNGFPSDFPDYEHILNNKEEKLKYVIHAEENAINFASKRNINLEDCTIYTTLFPCDRCYELIRICGIKRIVTINPSPDQEKKWGNIWKNVIEKSIQDNIEIVCYDF